MARVVEALLSEHRAGEAGRDDLPERALGVDPEAGLFLRWGLRERLASLLAEPQIPPTSVLMVGVEGVAELRATLGSERFAEFVGEMARRLQQALPRQASVGLWDWDAAMLLVVVPEVTAEGSAALADLVADAFDAPIAVADLSLRKQTLIGVVVAPDDGDEADVLIGLARTAAFRRVGRRRGAAVIASGPGSPQFQRNADLVTRLQKAISARAIAAFYQPRVDLSDGGIVGMEALARWRDPALGWVSPGEFIPLAERQGLLGDLTTSMLEQAVERVAELRAAGHAALVVAVNLSAIDLLDTALPGRVQAILDAKGLPGAALEMEVTESALVADT